MSSPDTSPLVRRCINGLCDHLVDHKPGQTLEGEAHLGASLGVSRSPLRLALAHLEAEGLLAREGRRLVMSRRVLKSDRVIDDDEPLSRAAAFEQWFLTAIAERRLRPGQDFTEVEVAEAAGVTTATAREVLARYAARRLIAKDPRRSWRMSRFDREGIAELWELRRLVERHALTRLFANRVQGGPAQIDGLLAEHRGFASHSRQSIAVFRDLDRRFHHALFAACSNRFIEDLRAMIDLLIHVQLADDAIGREGMRRGLDEHVAILSAIVADDRSAALAALDRHMASSEDIMNRATTRDHED